MNYQHAMTLYPTATRAMCAFFIDYFTACGTLGNDEALEYIEEIEDTDDADCIIENVDWDMPEYADEYDICEGLRLAIEDLEDED